MLHIFLSNRPDRLRYNTSGIAVHGYDFRIVDDQGRDLPDGEAGEWLVRGLSATDDYWNQREKSRRTFRGEWTATGDKYIRATESWYRYQGRADDMFKVSGIWVSPFEMEAALMSHSAVQEAAVMDRMDEDGFTKPMAFIVLKDPAMEAAALHEELRMRAKATAGPWK